MPELPEVETTRRGIEPLICGQIIIRVDVREPRLRWRIPAHLPEQLCGEQVLAVDRRGKYLLFRLKQGCLLIHLGMSGTLRIISETREYAKHDHVDIITENGKLLRFNDPRRFGAVLWVEGDPTQHSLLRHLGPEPLQESFNGKYLCQCAIGRKLSVKTLIMDSKVVVGVGNIYANEALFRAGIRPTRPAGRVSEKRYIILAQEIKHVLEDAIRQGGTTLKDFQNSEGRPGYFKQFLRVYGRGGEPCLHCGKLLKEVRIAQRSTVFCGQCQK